MRNAALSPASGSLAARVACQRDGTTAGRTWSYDRGRKPSGPNRQAVYGPLNFGHRLGNPAVMKVSREDLRGLVAAVETNWLCFVMTVFEPAGSLSRRRL